MGRLRFALVLVLVLTTGCSTASWVVNPPPHASDLYVTEDDVVEYFDRLSDQTPPDPEAVFYNPETDRYEMKSGVYKKALTKSVMYEIQKEKITEFTEDYNRETLGKAAKKDLTMFMFGVIVGIVSVFAVGGL